MNVEIPKYHENPEDSQLLICLTGSTQQILDKLNQISKEIVLHGKPAQGNIASGNLETYIRTPIWNKRKY